MAGRNKFIDKYLDKWVIYESFGRIYRGYLCESLVDDPWDYMDKYILYIFTTDTPSRFERHSFSDGIGFANDEELLHIIENNKITIIE